LHAICQTSALACTEEEKLYEIPLKEFELGATIALTATVYNATSDDILSGFVVRFYEVYPDGSRSLVGTATTNASGVAAVSYLYVAGPCTFVADVATGQNFITSPILLTIGNETSLYLNVTRCYSENASHWHAYRHTISGELFCGSTPLVCKKITINVNGTRHNAFTDSIGQFDIDWYLIPKDNKPTTYNVTAIFEDEDAANVTVYGYTPNATRYAVSTTIYYGLKPSINSFTLTVEPPKTEVKTAPKDMLQGNVTATQTSVKIPPQKTPQQMQREAENSGTLRIEHEWSWWFPWYRTHFVSVYKGIALYDQGISPLPFVGATLTCSNTFLNIIRDLWSLVIWPVAVAVAGAEFTALLASNCGLMGFVIALVISIGTKTLSLITNWNSINGLAGAFMGYLFSTVMGMLKWTWGFVADFLRLLMGIIDLAEFGFGNLYRIFGFPVSIAFGGQILSRLQQLGAIQ
jgi:hypothetical protein